MTSADSVDYFPRRFMSGSIIREKPMVLGAIRQNNLTNGQSPLKLFTHAKTSIIDIFKSIASYVYDSNLYLSDVIKLNQNLIPNERYREIQQLKERVNRILSILSRDHMKVVFFGRTSNGKSTVMNAMLRERILPVGMGHTTNCFLQIEGTDRHEPSVLTPNSDEAKSVNNLSMLSNALSKEKLESDSLVKILWPKDRCRLIREDIVLVDSPGIDVSTNLDQWIEKHCLDADVFILVVSAESTLAGVEKNFLHNVAQRISNPNIFILMNHWDAAANEPEQAESVRQQHLDRGLEFLCDELNLYDRKEALKHRIYFISAREVLLKYTNDLKTGSTDGYKERLAEFSKFEQEFEKCISKSAVKTKFEQHTNRGKEILSFLCETVTNTINNAQNLKQECHEKLNDYEEKNYFLERELRSMTTLAKDRIQYVSEDVFQRVAQTLNDEIKRLYSLVEEFDRPFSSEHHQIPLYKEDLHQWIEQRLNSNLQDRLHTALYSSLDAVHKEIKDHGKSVISDPQRRSDVDAIVPRSDFAICYRLDCSNLCSDFHEDIQFRFSLGLTSLWKRLIDNQTHVQYPSALTSKSGLITLGACALVWQNVGWKVLGFVAAIYGGFYAYERLMWTRTAQERAFKRQYADYASSKMRLIVDLTSGNASAQVQQELSRYFAQIIRYVDLEKDDLLHRIHETKTTINQLKISLTNGQKLKKQGEKIDCDFNQFSKQYFFTDPTN